MVVTMISYRVDGQLVILTTNGKSTEHERQALFDAIRADPMVPSGALLMIDIREYTIKLTQEELQDRVRAMIESLTPKVGGRCAVLVGSTSLRVGLGFQLFAGTLNFRVSIFKEEASAREWLLNQAE